MSVNNPIPFDNSYIKLPKEFYSKATPDTPPNPKLIIYNDEHASELGLTLTDQSEITNIFSGKVLPEGSAPVAMVYSGHQFGHFSPRLGDGRALLLGELIDRNNIRHDIHLKGSGPTEYSRRGDGKATVGPALREYLVSEAMHKLGIPTTRALAVVTTGELVQRELPLPGAVITRTSKSLIRVGTFEYFARHGDTQNLKQLLNYCIKRNFSELKNSQDSPLDFFKSVMKLQATLTAKWMSVGFIHGVMNTDNSSVCGLTIDYGPCAFMDHFEHNRVFSSIDRNGRYQFSNQPSITLWNLTRLAECLLTLYSENNREEATLKFEEEIKNFEPIFSKKWLDHFAPKLGIISPVQSDLELIKKWLDYIESKHLDFTNSFRNLSNVVNQNNSTCNEFNSFCKIWKKRIESYDINQVISTMNMTNPIYIPRNHLIEDMITKAIDGDFQPFIEFNSLLENPYTEQNVDQKYTTAPTKEQIVPATFCGT